MPRFTHKDFTDISAYEAYIDNIISNLITALEPFAEEPNKKHNNYPCHDGITTKEKCGRCSRAFAAYYAIKLAKGE